jgi:hypothetical protein
VKEETNVVEWEKRHVCAYENSSVQETETPKPSKATVDRGHCISLSVHRSSLSPNSYITMTDAPSWLSADAPAPAPAAPVPDSKVVLSTQAPPDPSASTNATAANGGSEESSELPGIILVMRLANMGAAITLIICSIFFMIGELSVECNACVILLQPRTCTRTIQ